MKTRVCEAVPKKHNLRGLRRFRTQTVCRRAPPIIKTYKYYSIGNNLSGRARQNN